MDQTTQIRRPRWLDQLADRETNLAAHPFVPDHDPTHDRRPELVECWRCGRTRAEHAR